MFSIYRLDDKFYKFIDFDFNAGHFKCFASKRYESKVY